MAEDEQLIAVIMDFVTYFSELTKTMRVAISCNAQRTDPPTSRQKTGSMSHEVGVRGLRSFRRHRATSGTVRRW
jgi:hypothetical protein